jgi:hypothetical protein
VVLELPLQILLLLQIFCFAVAARVQLVNLFHVRHRASSFFSAVRSLASSSVVGLPPQTAIEMRHEN